jgi:hypothetical protein
MTVNVVSRIKAFVIERAAPVTLLWTCIGAGYSLAPAQVLRLLSEPAGKPFDVSSFLDSTLLGLLVFGSIALLALFAVIEKAMPFGTKEQGNKLSFFERVWDEISSAAAHISLGSAAIWLTASPATNPFPVGTLAYLALAVFAFRRSPPSAAASSERT